MKKIAKKRGQALVEMAVVFPFFLLIVVGGIIDFGFAFYNSISLQHVAGDTARWAAERAEENMRNHQSVESYARQMIPEWWNNEGFRIDRFDVVDLEWGTGNEQVIRLQMSYDSPTYTPFYQIILRAATGATPLRVSTVAAFKIPTAL